MDPRRQGLLFALTALMALGFGQSANVAVPARQIELAENILREEGKANINQLFDENKQTIQDALSSMDPMSLGNFDISAVKGVSMSLSNGWLQNLSLMQRTGDCLVVYGDRVLTLELNIGWDTISFDFRYLLKALFIKIKGDIHGQLDKMKIKIALDVDFKSYQIVLRTFEFSNSGKLTIKFEGNKIDKFLNLILKSLVKKTQKVIMSTIEEKATKMIQTQLDSINEVLGSHKHHFTFLNLVTLSRSFGNDYEYTNDVQIITKKNL